MEVRYIPVTSSNFIDEDVSAFRSAVYTLPKPIVAYCRTGTRSTFLWALSEAPNLPMNEIISRAAAAGYDLKNIEAQLQSIQSNCPANEVGS
jgi:sulfide:quinone oxidoreductase